jgi:hypothetical protein
VDTARRIISEMSAIRLEMRLDAAEMLSACAETEPHWFERFHRAPTPLSAVSLTD